MTTVLQVQQIEAALRESKPSTGDRYQKLARTHRQAVALAATLATRLAVDTTREARQEPAHGGRSAVFLKRRKAEVS